MIFVFQPVAVSGIPANPAGSGKPRIGPATGVFGLKGGKVFRVKS
jgi:hypothetical protein